jgi:hypothetical protein
MVGQNRIYAPYMTVHSVISLPKIPYTHRIYMFLANPTRDTSVYALGCAVRDDALLDSRLEEAQPFAGDPERSSVLLVLYPASFSAGGLFASSVSCILHTCNEWEEGKNV